MGGPRVFASTVGHAVADDVSIVDHEPWMRFGECRKLPDDQLDVMFPMREDIDILAQPAKRICGRCSVKSECLVYALFATLPDDTGMPGRPRTRRLQGVWGGTTTAERAKLRQGF